MEWEMPQDVGIALLLTGLVVFMGVSVAQLRVDPRDWGSVNATVVSAESRWESHWEGDEGYNPIIRYRYEVERVEYESDAYAHPLPKLFEKGQIGGVMDALAVGKVIEIRYKRSDPRRSVIVLDPVAPAIVWDVAMGASVIGAVIAWGVVHHRRRRRSQTGPNASRSR